MTIKQSKPQKKRGRKPKGGKIIDVNDIPTTENEVETPNIILHLKCFIEELDDLKNGQIKNSIQAYNGSSEDVLDNHNLNFARINQNKKEEPKNKIIENVIQPSPEEEKILIEKLEDLNKFLYHIQQNNNNFKNISIHQTIEETELKSHCFWCTCDFKTPSIYIPKHEVNGKYEVYGCFCTAECAVAHLFEENIDQSLKWERYALLNYLYQNIFKQTKPFHPAPNPRYVLDKYFGKLSIEEYRTLLRSGKHIMVIDKPISKVFPEIHLDKHEFNEISENNKKKMKLMAPRRVSQQKNNSKNNILKNTFGNK